MKVNKQLPGLFRTTVGGQGSTLTDAFASLQSPHVSGCSQLIVKGELLAAKVPAPREQDVAWEMFTLQTGIHMVVTNCDYRHPHEEQVPGEGFVEFHFNLGGETRLSLQQTDDDDLDLGESFMLVCRQDRGTYYSVYCPAGPRRLVSIYIHPAILLNQLDIDFTSLNERQQSFFVDRSEQMTIQQVALTADIFSAVKAVLDNPFEDGARLRFYAAKCWELLCLSSREVINAGSLNDAELRITNKDLKLLEKARMILASEFSQPPTVEALARAIGTNTNKLKSAFKAIYGMTLFEYGLRERMTHALNLMTNEGASASEAARAIGYSNQASFSTAFKKFYGYSPRESRRR